MRAKLLPGANRQFVGPAQGEALPLIPPLVAPASLQVVIILNIAPLTRAFGNASPAQDKPG
jgi:hypothetical protein